MKANSAATLAVVRRPGAIPTDGFASRIIRSHRAGLSIRRRNRRSSRDTLTLVQKPKPRQRTAKRFTSLGSARRLESKPGLLMSLRRAVWDFHDGMMPLSNLNDDDRVALDVLGAAMAYLTDTEWDSSKRDTVTAAD